MGILAFFKKLTGTKAVEGSKAQTPVAELASAPVDHANENTSDPAAQTPTKVAPPKMTTVVPPRAPQKPLAKTSPLALTGGAKNQSDWLLLQIGKTGRAFIALAEKNKLNVHLPVVNDGQFVRHDMTAALLGYRLVLTAYHFHQDVPSLEALRFVRTAMTGMLHRAVDITVDQTGFKDKRQMMLAHAEEQFKFAEKEIAEACFQLRGNSPEPFMGFYSGLLPAFGFQDSPHALHQRYGTILGELYAKIESAMAARNHQITG